MEPNKNSHEFILTPSECWALGIETPTGSWPMEDSEGLLDLAIYRRERADDLSQLADYPAGTRRMQLQQQLEKRSKLLGHLVVQLEPFLPSFADYVEDYLKERYSLGGETLS